MNLYTLVTPAEIISFTLVTLVGCQLAMALLALRESHTPGPLLVGSAAFYYVLAMSLAIAHADANALIVAIVLGGTGYRALIGSFKILTTRDWRAVQAMQVTLESHLIYDALVCAVVAFALTIN